MRYDFRIRMDKETRESVIDLKCLNCDPDSLVPKDAYEQIRGGFAYKR